MNRRLPLLGLLLLVLPALAWAAPPAPCLADGGLDYYRRRASDFVQRNPGVAPPDYYLDYGDAYIRRFTYETRPLLSPAGQRWLDAARVKLQQAIEARRAADPDTFARLELDPPAFRSFAYETHAPAYETGLSELPLRDLILIGTTPDIQDTLGPDGLQQLLRVVQGLGKTCSSQGLSSCLVERVMTEKRELRRLLRDRLGVPPTVAAGRFIWRRFADSVKRALGLGPPRPGVLGALPPLTP
ncbi:MAG: hypothetical protein KDD82_12110 [Planctomycetes bacterium]|nr:hypothetical protein [Planctomycetota bacterium]